MYSNLNEINEEVDLIENLQQTFEMNHSTLVFKRSKSKKDKFYDDEGFQPIKKI